MNRREAIAAHFGGNEPRFTINTEADGSYTITCPPPERLICSKRDDGDTDIMLPGYGEFVSCKEICDTLANMKGN